MNIAAIPGQQANAAYAALEADYKALQRERDLLLRERNRLVEAAGYAVDALDALARLVGDDAARDRASVVTVYSPIYHRLQGCAEALRVAAMVRQ